MNSKSPTPATSVVAIARPAASLRWAAPLMLLLAVGLIVTDRIKPNLTAPAKMTIVDAVMPVFSAVANPMASIDGVIIAGHNLVAIHAENERLRLENERLRAWYIVAQRLTAENRDLRGLVDYQADWLEPTLSTRVVADTGGAFARSVLIDHGRDRNVVKGMPAVTASGVVGRVQDVGRNSARILLMTDINSRIPAMLEKSGERLVIAGDNRGQPRIDYIRPEISLAIGDIIVTSGIGGVFPAGLPLGTIVSIDTMNGGADIEARIQPSVELSRLVIVSLLPTATPLNPAVVPDDAVEIAPGENTDDSVPDSERNIDG